MWSSSVERLECCLCGWNRIIDDRFRPDHPVVVVVGRGGDGADVSFMFLGFVASNSFCSGRCRPRCCLFLDGKPTRSEEGTMTKGQRLSKQSWWVQRCRVGNDILLQSIPRILLLFPRLDSWFSDLPPCMCSRETIRIARSSLFFPLVACPYLDWVDVWPWQETVALMGCWLFLLSSSNSGSAVCFHVEYLITLGLMVSRQADLQKRTMLQDQYIYSKKQSRNKFHRHHVGETKPKPRSIWLIWSTIVSTNKQ